MEVRSECVGPSRRVQFDVAAQDMRKRTRLQKLGNPQGAFVVSRGIFNQQSARQEEIPGKKNPCSAVVEYQVRRVVPRGRNYVDSSATQIQMGNSVGQLVKRKNARTPSKSMGTTWTDRRDAN